MIDVLINKLQQWAGDKTAIRAILIVGSHARGAARPDSDIDIIVICSDPNRFLDDKAWLSKFGEVKKVDREDWGLVQSWRVFYTSGLEIEFGITTEQWCALEEIAGATGEVIAGGTMPIYDPYFLLKNLLATVK